MYQKRLICICKFLPRARPKAEVGATELVGMVSMVGITMLMMMLMMMMVVVVVKEGRGINRERWPDNQKEGG